MLDDFLTSLLIHFKRISECCFFEEISNTFRASLILLVEDVIYLILRISSKNLI
jgi:hypothetical protein